MKTNAPPTAEDERVCKRVAERYPEADALAAKYHNHKTLLALVVDEGGIPSYRPTLDCCAHPELEQLADAYDTAQDLRRDARMAYRGLPCRAPSCPRCSNWTEHLRAAGA